MSGLVGLASWGQETCARLATERNADPAFCPRQPSRASRSRWKKHGQRLGEGAAPAEDHRIRLDGIESVAFVVADLLHQMAGGEGHAEKRRRGEAATVEDIPQRIAEEEVESAPDQVGRRAEERSALPTEAG